MVRAYGSMAFVLLAVAVVHAARWTSTEPYFNNDETRHVTTGVFVRDALADGGWKHPKSFAVDYYLRYPALGLLVWPPGFYGVLGGWMALFGTSFAAAKSCLLAFFVVACGYTYALARRLVDPDWAAAAVWGFAFAPMIVEYREHVMLEMPTLACILGAMYHLEVYLDRRRWREAVLVGLWTAAAGCMRYDAVLLLPYVIVRLALGRELKRLLEPKAIVAASIALAVLGPLYYFTWSAYGSGLKAAAVGTSPAAQSFAWMRSALFYPAGLPAQLGWMFTGFSVVGFLFLLWRKPSGWTPHIAAVLTTYLFFSVFPELEARHAIYWVPSLAIAACALLSRLPYFNIPLAWAFLLGVMWSGWNTPIWIVQGYETAAKEVVARTAGRKVCLFDGLLNGGFIYYVRLHGGLHDWTVLRGDKLLYGQMSDPVGGYAEWAGDDAAMLELIHRFDPELIAVEDPRVLHETPAAGRLRRLLRERTDRFRLEATVPIVATQPEFRDRNILVFRNLVRNPKPETLQSLEMLSLGGKLGK